MFSRFFLSSLSLFPSLTHSLFPTQTKKTKKQRGSTSHSVDDLLARLSSTSSSNAYSREAVSAALAELERRHADAPGSAGAVAPIMFEPATGRFYDAS